MGYEIYTEHPESAERKFKDFAAWSMWAPQNAPWTGVSVSDMASLLQTVCAEPELQEACEALDLGGLLGVQDTQTVFRLASAASGLNEELRNVFQHAVQAGYGVRVVFSKGFGSLSASAYLEKHGSA